MIGPQEIRDPSIPFATQEKIQMKKIGNSIELNRGAFLFATSPVGDGRAISNNSGGRGGEAAI